MNKELLLRCTGKFVPTSASDFVGSTVTKHGSGAHAIAIQLERAVALAKANDNDSLKILINGLPGLGKTALAFYLQHLLGCDPKWSVTILNGTQVKVDVLDDLARSLHYKSFDNYRLIIVNEADAIPSVAQIRFLSMLDELDNGVAVCCTSNAKTNHFEERFHTRFQVFEILPPTSDELKVLINRFINDPHIVTQICLGAGGNVRCALTDAKGVLQNLAI